MLAAAVSPSTALLIVRILNAPFVPPMQATNWEVPGLVPEIRENTPEFRSEGPMELGPQKLGSRLLAAAEQRHLLLRLCSGRILSIATDNRVGIDRPILHNPTWRRDGLPDDVKVIAPCASPLTARS
jgi:hypothetical protein